MKQFTLKLIGIILLSATTLHCQSSKSKDNDNAEFRQILTGSTFDNWDGDPRFWRVEDDIIVGETSEQNPAEENTFLIWEDGEPADFEIKFEYRFVRVNGELAGNSGLQFRSERFVSEETPDLEHRVRGYQADFAVSDWIPGIHYEEGGRGILARRGGRVMINAEGEREEEHFAGEDSLGKYITHDEWNEYHVYANGDTLRAAINGQLMHEIIDRSPEARQEGILAFQIHTGPPMRVELRNVQLRILN